MTALFFAVGEGKYNLAAGSRGEVHPGMAVNYSQGGV